MLELSLAIRTDDPIELDQLTRLLHAELQALDIDDASLAGDTIVPPNAKGVDPALVSSIVVAVAGSRVLVQLGRLLQDFVNRSRHRKILIQDGARRLEISAGNANELDVIKAFYRAESPAEPKRPSG